MMRLSAAVAVALGVLVLAGTAQACSCAPLKVSKALGQADGAIVGKLLGVVPRSRLWADYRYRVGRVFKGPIEPGDVISVRSARRASACALPRRLDSRIGLFLARRQGRWTSGMCDTIAPRRLWLAAKREPRGPVVTAHGSCAS